MALRGLLLTREAVPLAEPCSIFPLDGVLLYVSVRLMPYRPSGFFLAWSNLLIHTSAMSNHHTRGGDPYAGLTTQQLAEAHAEATIAALVFPAGSNVQAAFRESEYRLELAIKQRVAERKARIDEEARAERDMGDAMDLARYGDPDELDGEGFWGGLHDVMDGGAAA